MPVFFNIINIKILQKIFMNHVYKPYVIKHNDAPFKISDKVMFLEFLYVILQSTIDLNSKKFFSVDIFEQKGSKSDELLLYDFIVSRLFGINLGDNPFSLSKTRNELNDHYASFYRNEYEFRKQLNSISLLEPHHLKKPCSKPSSFSDKIFMLYPDEVISFSSDLGSNKNSYYRLIVDKQRSGEDFILRYEVEYIGPLLYYYYIEVRNGELSRNYKKFLQPMQLYRPDDKMTHFEYLVRALSLTDKEKLVKYNLQFFPDALHQIMYHIPPPIID